MGRTQAYAPLLTNCCTFAGWSELDARFLHSSFLSAAGMHFVLLTLLALICVARAIIITFPQSPVATQNNTFSWARDEKDTQSFYLVKRKLDDSGGLTTFSEKYHVLANGSLTGEGSIYFRRAGLFQVAVFDESDKDSRNTLYSTPVTVVINPTSIGASQPTKPPQSGGGENHSGHGGGRGGRGRDKNMMQNNTAPQNSATPTPEDNPRDEGHKPPNVPLIVGFVLGSVGIIFLVAATLLWFRYRTRSRTMAFERNIIQPYPLSSPPRFDHSMSEGASEDSSTRNLIFTSPMSPRHASQLPPPPDIQSVASSGSFSITSPIVARQRDAERHRANDFSNFRLSMSTTSRSTSSAFRSVAGTRSSITSFPVPALPPRTRTNRQKLIEEKIQLFQSKMVLLQSRKPNMTPSEAADCDKEVAVIEQRVERLKQIHESDWALDLTNVAPEGLHD